MTAPAPTLLPHTAAPDRARNAAPAAAGGPRASDSPGFAAYLAREAPQPEEAPGERQAAIAPAAWAPDTAPKPEAPEAVAVLPGKALPPIRQKSAAPPAALLALAATKAPGTADTATDETGEPTGEPDAEEPEAATAVLTLALPGAAALPLPSPAAPAATPAAPTPARSSPATAAAPAPQPAAPRPDVPPAAPAAQPPHAAAFAVTSLVLERDAAAPAADAAAPAATPEQSAPETAAQNAARAQPSTLAALTGTPTPERPATRKLRSEADLKLPDPKSAEAPLPETAGALAQTQPSFAPASPEAPAISGPQPISFDQLVESIARARDGMQPAGPVAVAMHHAEFGRISLRIEGDDTGLSVALASPDPTFAPAVAAAHAAAVTAEPARPASSAEPRADGSGQGSGQNLSQNSSGSGNGQRQAFAAQRPATNAARAGAASAGSRAGIFA